jgi:endonuclease/exonuclease/phosphatase family metal-dependent hydrolase
MNSSTAACKNVIFLIFHDVLTPNENQTMKRLLKILLFIVLLPCVVLIILIMYATITDYKPDEKEVVYKSDGKADTLSLAKTYSLLIWNIGYAGLDKKMDFFYDGGEKVRTSKDQLDQNISCIEKFITGLDSVDFKLLQEVDISSKRSYHRNEVKRFSDDLSNNHAFYGKNYDVFFVPVPFTNPMGSVNSGVLSFSRYNPSEVTRISFPGQYSWPKRLFMLDRCFLVMRFPLSGGKQLLVVNTHNEAYDTGIIRDEQMAFLKKFLLSEYDQGNFIIVAGDWNQCPPNLQPRFSNDIFDTIDYKGIEPGFLPSGWTWAFDNTMPSNRRVDIVYVKGTTRTTVIDFFLLSPNLRSTACKTIDMGFSCSDHQPVQIKINFQ